MLSRDQRVHALYFSPRSPHSPLYLKRSPPFTHTSHARTSRLHTRPKKLHALMSTCSHAINELTLSTLPRAHSVLHAFLTLHALQNSRTRHARTLTSPHAPARKIPTKISSLLPALSAFSTLSQTLTTPLRTRITLAHQLLPRARSKDPNENPAVSPCPTSSLHARLHTRPKTSTL
jgi:hypothetical protein